MGPADIHRITGAHPGTRTLVLRGRKRPAWGFYVPDEQYTDGSALPGTAYRWVDYRDYDYATRRPVSEVRTG